MNVIERLGVKYAWKQLEGSMPAVKRYAPLIGSAVLAISVVLRLFGQNEVADGITTLGGLVGVTQQSQIPVGEIAAACAALTGVVLKVVSEVKKARA